MSLSYFADTETPIGWEKFTAHWPQAHRSQTSQNRKGDAADSGLPTNHENVTPDRAPANLPISLSLEHFPRSHGEFGADKH